MIIIIADLSNKIHKLGEQTQITIASIVGSNILLNILM